MTFFKLSTSNFWYFAILGLVVPFLPIFLNHRGFSSVEIGEILAIFMATRIVGPTLWAMLADKKGEQLSIIRLGALLTSLSFAALTIATGYWGITFVLALFSLFWTAILPQLEVLTLNSIRRSAKIYARIRLWGSIGFIVLSIIAGEVIGRYSPDAFIWIGLFILSMLFLSTLWLKQPFQVNSKTTLAEPIWSKCIDKSFIFFFIAGLLLQISFGPYYSFFALYLKDLSYPSALVGVFISIGVVAEIGIFLIAGALYKQFGLRALLTLSILLTALRWYFMAEYADMIILLVIAQILHAFSFGLYHSASIQFVQSHFNRQQQSRGQAIYIAGVYGVGGAIGAYISGLLWQEGQGAYQSFVFATVVALAATLFAALVKPKIKISN